MTTLSIIAQITIALSIYIVWVLRFDNIVNEFNTYRIPNLLRSMVGAAKITLAALLILAIWYPTPIIIPALLMAFLMLCAQVVHFRANTPAVKRLPSAALLLLCLFVSYAHYGNAV